MSSNDTDFNLWGWEQFFTRMQNFIVDADRHFEQSNEQYACYVIERMEVCLSNLRSIAELINTANFSDIENQIVAEYKDLIAELIVVLESIALMWKAYYDKLMQTDAIGTNAYQAPVMQPRPHAQGRPRYLISQNQLEHLSSMGFSWTEISSLLGVSRMTIYRRCREYGMLEDAVQTLSYAQLRVVLRDMRREHPNFGETMTMGYLRALGYRVSRATLRTCIHATDPIQTALRWQGGLTPRCPYSVPGPNSLWHLGMKPIDLNTSLL